MDRKCADNVKLINVLGIFAQDAKYHSVILEIVEKIASSVYKMELYFAVAASVFVETAGHGSAILVVVHVH